MSIETVLLKLIEQQKYHGAVNIKLSSIRFEPAFRDMCHMNSCGKFGTSWVCPPACGSFEATRKSICTYTDGILVQQAYPLADSFDYEGMMAGQDDFDKNFYAIIDALNDSEYQNWNALKAGSCGICETCTYPSAPCLFPKRAKSSLEACGINVSALCSEYGLSYINGKHTVTYFALFVYRFV